MDSTVRETYGLCKEGAQRHNYSGQRGYHPLLAVAAVTGAANFLREAISRMRHAGTTGPLTVRAHSGFNNHDIVAVCRDKSVRQQPSVRNLIEAISEAEWTPIPYWMEGAADVAETTYTPFQNEPDVVPVRLMVRRVKPTPGSQLALLPNYS